MKYGKMVCNLNLKGSLIYLRHFMNEGCNLAMNVSANAFCTKDILRSSKANRRPCRLAGYFIV